MRSHTDVGDVLSFFSLQVGLRGRQHLFKICIVTNGVMHFIVRIMDELFLLQAFQLTDLVLRGAAISDEQRVISL